MKKRILIAILVVLLTTPIFASSVPRAAAASVAGRVTVAEDGPYPYFTGDLVLNTDGSIEGCWQWVVFNFINHGVRFRCTDVSALSFPDDRTATFTGTFTCCDLPVVLCCSEGASCELTFVVTEGTPDTRYNPGRLLAALPIDAGLPLGFDYGMGRGKMLVYSADGVLISNHDGDYRVDVYHP